MTLRVIRLGGEEPSDRGVEDELVLDPFCKSHGEAGGHLALRV